MRALAEPPVPAAEVPVTLVAPATWLVCVMLPLEFAVALDTCVFVAVKVTVPWFWVWFATLSGPVLFWAPPLAVADPPELSQAPRTATHPAWARTLAAMGAAH